MTEQIVTNTNVPDDLTRDVLDVLYYVPKVNLFRNKINTRIKLFIILRKRYIIITMKQMRAFIL